MLQWATRWVVRDSMSDSLLDPLGLSKLKWRCRRGLLENDLLLARFFNQHEAELTVSQSQGLDALMDLPDHDLLDLLLGRSELPPDLDMPEVREVLALLRKNSGASSDPVLLCTAKAVAVPACRD